MLGASEAGHYTKRVSSVTRGVLNSVISSFGFFLAQINQYLLHRHEYQGTTLPLRIGSTTDREALCTVS